MDGLGADGFEAGAESPRHRYNRDEGGDGGGFAFKATDVVDGEFAEYGMAAGDGGRAIGQHMHGKPSPFGSTGGG